MDSTYVGVATPAPIRSSQVVATQSGCVSCRVPCRAAAAPRRAAGFFEVHDRAGLRIDPRLLPASVCCDARSLARGFTLAKAITSPPRPLYMCAIRLSLIPRESHRRCESFRHRELPRVQARRFPSRASTSSECAAGISPM